MAKLRRVVDLRRTRDGVLAGPAIPAHQSSTGSAPGTKAYHVATSFYFEA